MTQRQRWLLLWALAGALAAASDVVPRLLKLNDRFATGFLTAEAYAMCAGLLVSGVIMGALDPQGAARWGVVVGLAPLADTAVRMAQEGSVGNLWPIAIVLALVLGVPAASIGARTGEGIRSREPAAFVGLGVLAALMAVLIGRAKPPPVPEYWSLLAFAPPPARDSLTGGSAEDARAKAACYVTAGLPRLGEVGDSATVDSVGLSVGGARRVHGRPDSRYNQEALSQVTVVRLANSDSVELRLTTPARLTLRGRVTSAGEASGRWRCTDARALTPEFELGVDGEWVLRRGGWPTDKLTWPAIAH